MLQDSAHIQEKDAQWARERAERRQRSGSPQGAGGRRPCGARAGGGTVAPRTAAGGDAPRACRRRPASRCTRSPKPRRACASSSRSATTSMFAPAPGVEAALSRCRPHPRLGHASRPGSARTRRGTRSCSPATSASRAGRSSPTRCGCRTPTPLVVESTYGNRLHKDARVDLRRIRAGAGDDAAARQRRHSGVRRRPHAGGDLRAGRSRAPAAARRRSRSSSTRRWRRWRRGSTRATRRAAGSARAASSRAGWRQHPQRMRVLFTETPQDSMAINEISRGAVIIAASGMCDGGRIKHHLRHLPRAGVRRSCSPGSRPAGTLGRALVDGATQRAAVSRGRAGARVAPHHRRPVGARRPRGAAGLAAAASDSRRRAPSSSTASATRPSASRRAPRRPALPVGRDTGARRPDAHRLTVEPRAAPHSAIAR